MKKRWKAGFTAVEMLVVVLIVSLLTAGIITVSGAAVNVRSNELFASESEELAMTLNTALGDMLHYATRENRRRKTSGRSDQLELRHQKRKFSAPKRAVVLEYNRCNRRE